MLKPLTTMLIGSVQYTISDTEENVVDAKYISMGSMAAKEGKLCRGRAVGDTSNGFPGDYVIQYYDAATSLQALMIGTSRRLAMPSASHGVHAPTRIGCRRRPVIFSMRVSDLPIATAPSASHTGLRRTSRSGWSRSLRRERLIELRTAKVGTEFLPITLFPGH
jgi:hypothetical protein